MGATTFITRATGKTSREAFGNAIEEANDRNGHQEGYSGDIQTVHGYREVYGAPDHKSDDFHEWVDDKLDTMDKRECKCIDITNKGDKEKTFLFFGWGAE